MGRRARRPGRWGWAARAAVPALALALLLPATGCLALPGHLDVGPLYAETRTGAGCEVRLPLLLSRYAEDAATGATDLRVLWPLGHFRSEGREWDYRFLPVYYDVGRVDMEGFIDRDWFIGGVMGGDSADEGSYFAIIPFGGVLKGLLAKDEIAFVLFPAYLYTRDKAYESWHVLFPFINWIAGAGYSGFRVLPFYAHYEREDAEGHPVYNRTWVLWPFYTHEQNNLNADAPTEVWHLWPAYGFSDGPTTHRRTILYPLFRWEWDDAGDWEVQVPFPFLIFGGGPGHGRYDLWPIYGYRFRESPEGDEQERYRRHFFLWPIGRYEERETAEYIDTSLWILPFFWHYAREWRTPLREPAGEETEWKIWPLFRYRETREGDVAVDLLSILWFKDPEGFEAIYDPLFRLFHSWTDEAGGAHTRLLWGIYDRWVSPADDASETSFLFGMFRWIRRGDERAIRLFWLPEIRVAGGAPEEAPAGATVGEEAP